MRIESFIVLPQFGTNTYLVWDETTRQAMIIDLAKPSDEVWNVIENKGITLKYIVNTHGHADHIGGNSFIRGKTGAPICIHPADALKLVDAKANLSTFMGTPIYSDPMDIPLTQGCILTLGNITFTVLHTPGHSAGCISLFSPGVVFSGDTLFAGSVGRTDLPDGNFDQLNSSIRSRLYTLADETVVYPGHGEPTTIGEEKRNNPFVKM